MSGELSSKSRRDTITIYDAFNLLKERLPDNPRYALEGAAIIASPSILRSKRNKESNHPNIMAFGGDVHDSRYKLQIAQTVTNSLINFYENSLDDKIAMDTAGVEVEKLLSLPVVYDYVGYGRRGMNLPFVVTQIYEHFDEKKLPEVCIRIGRITEKNIKSFYTNRGYIINKSNRPKDVASYLIAEYEYFTRIAAEISNRSNKKF